MLGCGPSLVLQHERLERVNGGGDGVDVALLARDAEAAEVRLEAVELRLGRFERLHALQHGLDMPDVLGAHELRALQLDAVGLGPLQQRRAVHLVHLLHDREDEGALLLAHAGRRRRQLHAEAVDGRRAEARVERRRRVGALLQAVAGARHVVHEEVAAVAARAVEEGVGRRQCLHARDAHGRGAERRGHGLVVLVNEDELAGRARGLLGRLGRADARLARVDGRCPLARLERAQNALAQEGAVERDG